MFNSLQLLKRGGACVGLALIVSLAAASPAKAEFMRGWENTGFELVALHQYMYDGAGQWHRFDSSIDDWAPFRKGWTSGGWGGTNDGNGKDSASSRAPIVVRLGKSSITIRSGDLDNLSYLDYALGFLGIDGDILEELGFLQSINGEASLLQEALASGPGNFFFGLESLADQNADGSWSISFQFDPTQAFRVALYGKPNPDAGNGGGGNEIPEPATLAIMGLGLAGLGLARRRMKK